jgi:hypothetical protein
LDVHRKSAARAEGLTDLIYSVALMDVAKDVDSGPYPRLHFTVGTATT